MEGIDIGQNLKNLSGLKSGLKLTILSILVISLTLTQLPQPLATFDVSFLKQVKNEES